MKYLLIALLAVGCKSKPVEHIREPYIAERPRRMPTPLEPKFAEGLVYNQNTKEFAYATGKAYSLGGDESQKYFVDKSVREIVKEKSTWWYDDKIERNIWNAFKSKDSNIVKKRFADYAKKVAKAEKIVEANKLKSDFKPVN